MQLMKVNELKDHPQNNYFFDDIIGSKWDEFLKSIQTSGVIEPIVITQDKTIVSGHQRVRACKYLNIDTILCEVKVYDADENIVRDLIETNMKQRGTIGGSDLKMGRIFVKLEEIYGIKRGGDRGHQYTNTEANGQNVRLVDKPNTQKELAEQNNISQKQLSRYKKLTQLIPELQELSLSGELTTNVALNIISKLSRDEQSKLIEDLGRDKIAEMTQKQTQEYILRIRELENKPPKVIDKTDYTTIDTLKMRISHKEKDIELLQREKSLLEKKCKLNETDALNYKKMKSEIEFLTKQKDDISRQIESATELSGLAVEVKNILFIKLSPVKYSRAFECLNSSVAMDNFISLVDTVRGWCDEIDSLIGRKFNNILEATYNVQQ